MKRCTVMLALITGICLMTTGCGKSEKAASITELEKAFQLKKPATDGAQPLNSTATPQIQGDRVQQTVSQAVSALRSNAYAEAFVTLRAVQAAPGLTLDQYTAVVNARLAVEKRAAEKALAGDPAAVRAVEAIKKMAR